MSADIDDEGQERKNWGHCQNCKFFGHDGAKATADLEVERLCHEPELSPFELVVSGACGCNHFEQTTEASIDSGEPSSPDAPA